MPDAAQTPVAEARAAWNDDRGYATPTIPGFGLEQVFGARETAVVPVRQTSLAIQSKHDAVPLLTPGTRLPGAVYQESVETLGGAQVLAAFEDGSPAMVASSHGKGKTLYVGSYLSLAYERTKDVQLERFFQGLPSPAAACLLAGLVWAVNEYQVKGADVKWLAWGLTMFAGLTMVSNFKFYSGKDINLRKSVSFSVVVGIALAMVFLITVSSTLPEMLFILFVAYGASGYVIWMWERIKGRPRRPPAPPPAA